MAKYPVYSYRDNKVGFGMPIVEMNEAAAVRGFSMAVNHSEGLMGFAPSDYDLYSIGEFDTEKGTLVAGVPRLIVSGASVYGDQK